MKFSPRETPVLGVNYDTIVSQIKKASLSNPNKKACVHNNLSKSYAEVIDQAMTVAKCLDKYGLKKGDLIFVRLHSSLEVPLIYLAIMLLGGIFVPVNPLWPRARLESILSAFTPRALITYEPLHIELFDVKLLMVSSLFRNVENSISLPNISIKDPIYGFFTSGTTGLPKCAINIHKGIKNRFDYMTNVFKYTCHDNVVLQNSNLSFDSSIWQILWPLTQGGTVIIRDGSAITDFDRILEIIANNNVKMTDFVPTIFHQFVRYVENNQKRIEKLKSLKALLIGGEAIEPELVWCFKNILPGVEIYNTYGPTECSIGMMFHRVTDKNKTYIPIGLPIDNTFAVILNEQGKRAKPLEKGEIVIGGDCLGLGYLNDPVKTNDAFKPNPFENIPGHQVYLTGDIGYQDEEGLFHFIGRKDDQVKIGGSRLELSEIESNLMKLPSVEQVKAITYQVSGFTKVACFLKVSDTLSLEQVKSHLENRIPKEFMPSQIQFIPDFPQNDNGKIDGKALHKFINYSVRCDVNSTSRETQVISLIEETIGIKVLHTEQNLLDAGANSMDIYLVCNCVKRFFGVDITPSILFNNFSASAVIEALNVSTVSYNEPSYDEQVKLINEDREWLEKQNICIKNSRSRIENTVFFTGGTGYIGIHTLSWLLKNSTSQVLCLVRDTLFLNLEAFKKVFEFYKQPIDDNTINRITPIFGNLGQPCFALSDALWNQLASKIDTIYALGAKVNLRAGYAELRCDNIFSLQETIRLAAASNSYIKYISTNTINAFLNEYGNHWNSKDILTASLSGYEQTKLVCEDMLQNFSKKGGKVSIIRVGDVVPDTPDGMQNVKSTLNHMLVLFKELKAIPKLKIELDIVPISSLIKYLMTDTQGVQVHSEGVPFVDFCCRYLKNDFEVIPAEEFHRMLRAMPNLSKEGQLIASDLLKSEFETLEEAVLNQVATPFERFQYSK